MINSKQKGISPKKIQVQSDEPGEYRHLPKYICYKAALLREKRMVVRLLTGTICIFIAYFIHSRLEISQLHDRLRSKEYILAPGLTNFVTVHPNLVPDSYVSHSVNDFISTFGNVSRGTIYEQFDGLKRYMTNDLRVRFDNATRKWIGQVNKEELSQIVKVLEKHITTDEGGNYRVVASIRASLYSGSEYLGTEDQVIKMTLRLVAPEMPKRWFLEITDFSWSKGSDIENQ